MRWKTLAKIGWPCAQSCSASRLIWCFTIRRYTVLQIWCGASIFAVMRKVAHKHIQHMWKRMYCIYVVRMYKIILKRQQRRFHSTGSYSLHFSQTLNIMYNLYLNCLELVCKSVHVITIIFSHVAVCTMRRFRFNACCFNVTGPLLWCVLASCALNTARKIVLISFVVCHGLWK